MWERAGDTHDVLYALDELLELTVELALLLALHLFLVNLVGIAKVASLLCLSCATVRRESETERVCEREREERRAERE